MEKETFDKKYKSRIGMVTFKPNGNEKAFELAIRNMISEDFDVELKGLDKKIVGIGDR